MVAVPPGSKGCWYQHGDVELSLLVNLLMLLFELILHTSEVIRRRGDVVLWVMAQLNVWKEEEEDQNNKIQKWVFGDG